MNQKLALITLMVLLAVGGWMTYRVFTGGSGFGGNESRPPLSEGPTATPSPWLRDAQADQTWQRFRGPNGSGYLAVADDVQPPPATWSEDKNLRWKTPLPGPGSSSPVLTADRVFVTCYSGYGVDAKDPGDQKDLVRHLLCIDRNSGNILWQEDIPAVQPELRYGGNGLPIHGYATSTPVTDGKRVFAFFGKSGVHAYDLEGNRLWQKSVGTELNQMGWGSCSSPLLYNDLLIVNAAEESSSLIAFDKETGEEVWRATSPRLPMAFTTPVLVPVSEQRTDLVMPVLGEVWGLNPADGKLVWYCESPIGGNVSPVPIVDGLRVYCFGGFQDEGSLCVKAGGHGDVTQTHVVWTSTETSYISTPLLVDQTLYWFGDDRIYYSMDAETGELIEKQRLPTASFGSGKVTYASPVRVDDQLYIQTRDNGVVIVRAQPELEVVAHNRFAQDDSFSNATPALADSEIYLRSNRFLYAVGPVESPSP